MSTQTSPDRSSPRGLSQESSEWSWQGIGDSSQSQSNQERAEGDTLSNDEEYDRLLDETALEERDYYAMLGLPRQPAPTPPQIRSAFHSLSLRLHPDKQPPHLQEIAKEQYVRLRTAYETLINPQKRVVYDVLGEEGVKAEWGPGGSMAKGGEAESTQVGVKAMTPAEFRRWFLRLMKRRERQALEELVSSKSHIRVNLDAVGFFHPDVIQKLRAVSGLMGDHSLAKAPPPLQATELELGHEFDVPLPSLGKLINTRLGLVSNGNNKDGTHVEPDWEEETGDDTQLTVSAGIEGNIIGFAAKPKHHHVEDEDDGEEGYSLTMPGVLARQFSLGFDIEHAFPEKPISSVKEPNPASSFLHGTMVGLRTELLPERRIQASLTRPITLIEGTQPFFCRIQTTFQKSLLTGPPSVEVTVTRAVGLGKTLFCSWSSGSSVWPPFVQQLFSRFMPNGEEGGATAVLSTVVPRMVVGISGALSPAVAEATQESTADGRVQKHPSSNRTWNVQLMGSVFGNQLSATYGQDFFASASTAPVRSAFTRSGEYSGEDSSSQHIEGSRGIRVEVEGRIGPSASFAWQIRGLRRIGNFTRIGMGVGLQGVDGVFVAFSWNRLGHSIDVPVLVCPLMLLSVKAVVLALSVPVGAYSLLEFGLIRPRSRRQRKTKLAKRRNELQKLVDGRREEAQQASRLMERDVMVKQAQEAERNGLVILKAEYGSKEAMAPRRPDPRRRQSRDEIADVTIAVAALVDEGQLSMPRRLQRSDIVGFYDPAPLQKKRLRVRYLFAGREHVVEVDDDESLTCPMRSHRTST
ncbi:hypothetical protein L228DRAFT_213961 [Xylona heveae TC161]|uniref:J domain-containing protein n=1 Tax=Xylona heveae (strain CBS 132557 / TC161) TaxID=1328760 RepID=A0A165AAE9_XYLHT|nr:hypothetical protein L228DRAFT_213961 [Xylona heveae TC161]KZF20169.1 hypothetical protein L228DRAFT_213961 [Xylona heveae TC161]